MPDFGVNLGCCERKLQKFPNKINKNLNDLKLIFLELVQVDLYIYEKIVFFFSILRDCSRANCS